MASLEPKPSQVLGVASRTRRFKMNDAVDDGGFCLDSSGPLEDTFGFLELESDKAYADGEEINISDFGDVDVEADTESMRHESKERMLAKSNQLKQFHEKICVRVTERERQNRLETKRAQQHLDDKCAKAFSAAMSWQQDRRQPSVRISARPYFRDLMQQKKASLPKDCPLGHQIEKVLRAEVQVRDEILRSTEISRPEEESTNSDHENGGDENNTKSDESPVLLPEQRAALYATVRRQYMEMNRAKAHSGVWQYTAKSSNANKVKGPKLNDSIESAVQSSRIRQTEISGGKSTEGRCPSSIGVKIVDITSGCEVRAHRQSLISLTPWRKKKTNDPTASPTTKERERFLRALQAQLGTPPLCSCGKSGPTTASSSQPCANNCAFYKQPKKREKLLTSVYKQQQQDMVASSTAASPLR